MGGGQHPVEVMRRTYASTQPSGGVSTEAAEIRDGMTPEEQAYMVILMGAMKVTRWKTHQIQRDVLFALRAIVALGTMVGTRRRKATAEAVRAARSADQQAA